MCLSVAVLASLAAVPAEAADLNAQSPVTGVSVVSIDNFTTPVKTPNAVLPELGLKVTFDVKNPVAGDTFSVLLPSDVRATIAATGQIATANGTVVGTFNLDPADASGRTVLVTLGNAVTGSVDLSGNFVFQSSFKPGALQIAGGTYSGTVISGSKNFTIADGYPTAAPYIAPTSMMYSDWTSPKADNGGSQAAAISATYLATGDATAPGGQWIGLSAMTDNPGLGAATPDCASVVVRSVPAGTYSAALPSSTVGTVLTLGVDYTVNCADGTLGAGSTPTTGVTILNPSSSVDYSVSETFSTVSRAPLPSSSAAAPFGGYARYITAGLASSVAAHLADPTAAAAFRGGIILLDPAGTATLVAAKPAIGLTLTANPATGTTVAAGQEISYTLAVKNNGDDALSTASAIADLSKVLNNATLVSNSITASTGSASLTGSSLKWSGALPKPGATAVISFKVTTGSTTVAGTKLIATATATGTDLGQTTVKASAETVQHSLQVTAAAPSPSTEAAVPSATTTATASQSPEAAVSDIATPQESLAYTGSNSSLPLLLGGALLVGGSALALASRRRKKAQH
nr:Ig-like domain-containing protein [Psychromicrobium silvestre]